MWLVDHQIKLLAEETCMIDSFDCDCLTNIGYDLRSKQFHVSSEPKESVTLQPNESAFVESVEVVDMPEDMMGMVVLKNSRIRQGLSLSSPVYQPGHKTRIFFRLTNVSGNKITLYKGEKYATIMFGKLDDKPDHPYSGAFVDEFAYRGLGDYKDIYSRQVREIEEKTLDLKAVEKGIYSNVLVILTVFVALFSFLTTNISLAVNSATVEQYLIFNALMLGCISFLAALIKTIISTIRGFWKNLFIWIPAVVAFCVAFLLYFF